MSTEQTKKDIDFWTSQEQQDARYSMLDSMATEAGINMAFKKIPRSHFTKMSYDQYLINVYALGKIKAIYDNSNMIGNFVDKYGNVHYKQLEGEY